jgi:hypothetical protein
MALHLNLRGIKPRIRLPDYVNTPLGRVTIRMTPSSVLFFMTALPLLSIFFAFGLIFALPLALGGVGTALRFCQSSCTGCWRDVSDIFCLFVTNGQLGLMLWPLLYILLLVSAVIQGVLEGGWPH